MPLENEVTIEPHAFSKERTLASLYHHDERCIVEYSDKKATKKNPHMGLMNQRNLGFDHGDEKKT